MKFTLDTLPSHLFDLHPGDRIFLRGNLGAGKTTFAQALIRRHFDNPSMDITSPTYIYYQSYPSKLYHFDCYRIEHPSDILRIGAQDIFDDPESICIIEWPEKLGSLIDPTKTVEISIEGEGRDLLIK